MRWDLIFKALDLFGFGEYVTSAIETIFKGIKMAVCNAGFPSQFFRRSRGIRQKCLFTIKVELLAIMVHKAASIKGIQVGKSEFKISQYAIDSTFFICNYMSLDSLLNLLRNFT